MRIADMFLTELEWEAPVTRKMLERVPEDRWAWQPHDKSTRLGELASHVATLPDWATMTVTQTGFDMAPKDGPRYEVPKLTTTAALVEAYDQRIEQARAALAAATDEDLQVIWTLQAGGHILQQFPRFVCLRQMVFNHIVHHRAQLGVYLRLNDVPLPASYGPSGDEMPAYAPPGMKPKASA